VMDCCFVSCFVLSAGFSFMSFCSSASFARGKYDGAVYGYGQMRAEGRRTDD
jgi:hypothetical protein